MIAGRNGPQGPLRVLVVADPFIPVPPKHYGGIERIVDFLVRGLVSGSHEVTLLGHPESTVPCRRWSYGVPPHEGWSRRRELVQASARILRGARGFDVVHSFGRLAALGPVLPLRRLAKIQSYQRDEVPWRSVRIATRMAGDSMRFTACSSSMLRRRPDDGPAWGRWATVWNGVETVRYPVRTDVPADAPLVWLGRLEPVKGCHHAIEIARRSGRRLVVAGNLVPSASAYFEQAIRPHLDGDRVRYVGPVTDPEKADLLGNAAALLMPIEWEEPFGIVMVEAMACGTPVIAFRRGSVPEVVRAGVSGVVCDSVESAVEAVRAVASIPRSEVRRHCERNFDAGVITRSYVRLYRDLLRDVRGPSAVARPAPHV